MIRFIFRAMMFVGFIWILVLVFSGLSIFKLGSDVLDTKREMQNNLREKVVVNSDTLTIKAVDWINKTYTLSDGGKIGKEKCEKLIIKN